MKRMRISLYDPNGVLAEDGTFDLYQDEYEDTANGPVYQTWEAESFVSRFVENMLKDGLGFTVRVEEKP